MKTIRHSARLRFIVLVAIIAMVVAGCTNVRQGVAWPDLDLVTINEEPRVIVSYNDRIVAIDPYQGGQIHVARDADGELIRSANGEVQEWNIELRLGGNNQTFYVSPFRVDDNFVFPTYDNRFIEVDVQSSAVLSEDGIPVRDGVIADVAIGETLIYVPYRLGGVQALDRDTYEVVWTFETEDGVWSSPLLEDGVIYFGTIGHGLYALDAMTGAELWQTPVDLEGAIASTPILHQGFLYVGSYSHKLYKISLSGTIVAEYEGDNWIWGTPAIGLSSSPTADLSSTEEGASSDDEENAEEISSDILYYTDLNGYVYALNTDDLSEVWASRPATRGIRPAPIVTEQFVIVAARNGTVYWLDRETGQTVQEVEVDGRPELLSDILYLAADEENGRPELLLIASTDGKRLVNAFNMDTFSLQWVYEQ